MYYNCNFCHIRILRHSGHITCCACSNDYHIKCITIVPAEISYIRNNSSEWLCESCLSTNLPFNQIEDQNEFLDTTICLNYTGINSRQISDKVLNPIEIKADFNEMDVFNDVDPDVNFYNGFQQSINKCKYYMEDVFNKELGNNSSADCFSMMHLNIRKAKKKTWEI